MVSDVDNLLQRTGVSGVNYISFTSSALEYTPRMDGELLLTNVFAKLNAAKPNVEQPAGPQLLTDVFAEIAQKGIGKQSGCTP